MMDHRRGAAGAFEAMTTTVRTVSRWQMIMWALVGVLIVAHGCHAGRDTELRAPATVHK
jgi:hypothetical protein